MTKIFDILEQNHMPGASWLSKYLVPRKRICSFCGKKFHHYKLHGHVSELSQKHHFACMGLRRGDCPFCGSKDKERWLWYVLENYTLITKEKCTVLHFAPEYAIRKKITENKQCKYLSGDIVEGRADEVIDMRSINYPDSTFDYIIASMVLEHIAEEEKALAELVRVAKKGGTLILTLPVSEDISNTWEDINITSEVYRLSQFGQEDHVRVYGKDYIQWLRKRGLDGCDIKVFTPRDLFPSKRIREMGIPEDYGCIVATVKK